MKLQPRSEKGLLTPDNCVITLIDHQPQMLFGVTSVDRQSLINNVVGCDGRGKAPCWCLRHGGGVCVHDGARRVGHSSPWMRNSAELVHG